MIDNSPFSFPRAGRIPFPHAPGVELHIDHDYKTDMEVLRASIAFYSTARVGTAYALSSDEALNHVTEEMLLTIQDEAIKQLGLEERITQRVEEAVKLQLSAKLYLLRKAWTDPGNNPSYHYAEKSRLFISWSTLANAIERLFT